MSEPLEIDPTAPLSEPPRSATESETVVDNDFEPSATDSGLAPLPRVIVRDQRRGLWSPLIPPLLIVAVAVVATAYRPTIRSLLHLSPEAPRILDRPSTHEPQLRPPIVLKVETVPAPRPASPSLRLAPPLAKALPRPMPERLRPLPAGPGFPELAHARGPEPLRPDRPEPQPNPTPAPILAPPAADETRLALEQINREAARRHEQRVQAEELKDRAPDIEHDRMIEQARLNDDRRDAFHEELRRVLDRWGNQAGPHIIELAGQNQTGSPPGADRLIQAEARKFAGKLDRSRRITLSRTYGLPEPLILADLVREQLRLMSARNGPRSRDEAVVRAARLLLRVPLDEAGATAADPDLDVLDVAR